MTTRDTDLVTLIPSLPSGIEPQRMSEECDGGLQPLNCSSPGDERRDNHAPEIPAAITSSSPQRLVLIESHVAEANRRKRILAEFDALVAAGHSKAVATNAVGVSAATLCRWRKPEGTIVKRELCGRRPEFLPSESELAVVREFYAKLDVSVARGRGLGSSKIAAYRIAARESDPRLSAEFKAFILNRMTRRLPPSWMRLLDTSAAVIDYGRDQRTTQAHYISTPRNRTIVDEAGNESALRCGDIFEADDGTINFYCYVPWPFGGDKCSEKFGVRLSRWQLLAVVDVHSEMCVAFDVVARNAASYRGEDAAALLGRTMIEEGMPRQWRLERGSWESGIVKSGLQIAQVPVMNAWHSKQKSAVERFFNRLWTPASLIPGHAGRDRGRFKHTTDLALACADGRRDPRDYFLSLEAAMPKIIAAIQFANTELIESRSGWGKWMPQERWEEHQKLTPIPKLHPDNAIFFAREQRTWTVRKATLGGSVEGPLLRFPIYFQCEELAFFEGCKVKCYFDPYADPVLGTLVLQEAWREFKPGHVIATNVPALELPPQAVLSEDGWQNDEQEHSLAIRKAISKSVRTEYCNWRGQRTSEARDGLGNVAKIERNGTAAAPAPVVRNPVAERVQVAPRADRLAVPDNAAHEARRARLAEMAARVSRIDALAQEI